jgi:hypothetical protein
MKAPSAIVAVRGDYGSGKTFLLQDAIACLRAELVSVTPTVLIAPCIGGDVVAWYRETIGPGLKQTGVVKELMLRLYAGAAKTVAGKANLTVAAVAKLEEEPWAVYDLLNAHRLSRTAVDEVVAERLESIAGVTEGDVRAALLGLLRGETESMAERWLYSEHIDDAEQQTLRVKSGLDSSRLAAEVLVAVARLHSAFGRVFALFVDELEHFTRFDSRRRDGESNVTWLKRLLEAMAATGSVVFIAGHYDAWDSLQSDSLDRFTPGPPIEMLRLDERDIARLAGLLADSEDALDSEAAALVGRLTNGNIRQVLRLLYALKLANDKSAGPISHAEIERIAEDLGQKLSLEKAIHHVEETLTRRGLEVERESALAGVRFDLVGTLGGRARIVFEFRDAGPNPANVAIVGDVKRFIEQVAAVQPGAPGTLGVFVSDAGIGAEISDVLAVSNSNCLAFDLARHDFAASLDRELDLRLGVRHGSGATSAIEQLSAVTSAALLDRRGDVHVLSSPDATRVQVRETDDGAGERLGESVSEARKQAQLLQSRLDSIESRRAAEAEELRQRVDALAGQLRSDRDREIAGLLRPADGPRQTLHVTFSDVTKRVSVTSLLTDAVGVNLVPLVALALAAAFTPTVAGFVSPPYYYVFGTAYIFVIVALIAVISGIAMRVRQLQKFHETRVQLLREIYVRTESAALLLRGDNLMHRILERYGPLRARAEASDAVEYLLRTHEDGMDAEK